MNLRRDWNEFWFGLRPSGPLGLFRMVMGLIVLCWGALMAPDLFTWYSERGVMPIAAMRAFNTNPIAIHWEINILDYVQSNAGIVLIFVILMIAALFLTVGFFTRISTIVVFLLLTSFQHRDEIILNSGDIFLRIMIFYLMFAPAGASCSVDRLLRIWRGREAAGDPPPVVSWAQRLMQIQVSIVYLATFLGKANGSLWQNGTAIYYPLHMAEMERFWVPLFSATSNSLFYMCMLNILTYSTMAIELSLGSFIWVPKLRPYVIAAGTMLHVGIEYALNIPLFSALMISSYINFLNNEWIDRFTFFCSRLFSRQQLTLRYADRGALPAMVAVLSRTDCLHLITFIPLPSTKGRASDTLIEVEDRYGVVRTGMAGLRRAFWRMPATWLKASLCLFPAMMRFGDRYLAGMAASPARQPAVVIKDEPVSAGSA